MSLSKERVRVYMGNSAHTFKRGERTLDWYIDPSSSSHLKILVYVSSGKKLLREWDSRILERFSLKPDDLLTKEALNTLLSYREIQHTESKEILP